MVEVAEALAVDDTVLVAVVTVFEGVVLALSDTVVLAEEVKDELADAETVLEAETDTEVLAVEDPVADTVDVAVVTLQSANDPSKTAAAIRSSTVEVCVHSVSVAYVR